MRVEQRVRQIRLVELAVGDRARQPPVVGLASDLQDPARHRDGDPVAASSRTSGYIIFPAGSPATDTPPRGAGPRSPARATGVALRNSRFSRAPPTSHRLGCRPRRRPARASCSDTTPRSRSRPRCLRNRTPGSRSTSNPDHVLAELSGIGPGHGAHPSSSATWHHRSDVTSPCSSPPPGARSA